MNEQTVQAAANEFPPPPAQNPGWDAFEDALTWALSVLEEEFLVVSAGEGHRFVQFHVSRVDGVFAETASNAYRGPDRQLDAGQLAALVSLKWAPPTRAPDAPASVPRGSPNHFREFPPPYSCAEVARFAVATLDGTTPRREPRRTPVQGLRRGGAHRHPPGAPHRAGPGATDPGEAPREAQEARRVRQAPRQVLAAARSGTGLGSPAGVWRRRHHPGSHRQPHGLDSAPARIPSTCACTSTSCPASRGTRRSWDGCTR